jgi:TRAP-type C4-dicarboxylate transport system permease small subunit
MQAFLRRLQAAEQAVAVAAILACAGALIADLLGREVFGQGLFGAQRAAVHLSFVAGMLGFVLATGKGAHLRVKATDALLPRQWAPGIERLGSLVSAAILGALAWYATRFAHQTLTVGERSVTLGIPIWPLQAVMVYAFVSAGLRHLAYAWAPNLRPAESEQA